MNRLRSLLALCAAVCLTACEKDAPVTNDWVLTEEESIINGHYLVATREYPKANAKTRATLEVRCAVDLADLRVVISTFENKDDSTSDDDVASELNVTKEGFVSGDLKMTPIMGWPAISDAGEYISLHDYSNRVAWDLGYMSLDLLWRQDLRTQARVAIDLSDEQVDAMNEAFDPKSPVTFDDALKVMRRTGRLAALGQGALLRELLPVGIRLLNTGGEFEVLIPADEPAVQKVIDACAGEAYWDSTRGSEPTVRDSVDAMRAANRRS